MCNAYADPEKPLSRIRPVLQSAGSIALALFGQALMVEKLPSFAVPRGVMLYGSCASLVLVSTLRMLFPQILSRRSHSLLLHVPLVLRRPQLIRRRVAIEQIRQTIREVPTRLRVPMWTLVCLVVTLLLASTVWSGVEAVLTPRHVLMVCVIVLVIYFGTRE